MIAVLGGLGAACCSASASPGRSSRASARSSPAWRCSARCRPETPVAQDRDGSGGPVSRQLTADDLKASPARPDARPIFGPFEVHVKPKILGDPTSTLEPPLDRRPPRPPRFAASCRPRRVQACCPMRGQLSGVLDEVRLQLELDHERGTTPLSVRARALRSARTAGDRAAERQSADRPRRHVHRIRCDAARTAQSARREPGAQPSARAILDQAARAQSRIGGTADGGTSNPVARSSRGAPVDAHAANDGAPSNDLLYDTDAARFTRRACPLVRDGSSVTKIPPAWRCRRCKRRAAGSPPDQPPQVSPTSRRRPERPRPRLRCPRVPSDQSEEQAREQD